VRTTHPVNFSVDDKLGCRDVTKKTVVEDALVVAEDALCSSETGLTRVMHVKTHLLDCVGNVRHGEAEVLESLSQTTVGSRVTNMGNPHRRRPCFHVKGDLGLSVHERGTRLAVNHTSSNNNNNQVF
jgi:hypothetical protein